MRHGSDSKAAAKIGATIGFRTMPASPYSLLLFRSMRINTIAPPISGIPNSDTLNTRLIFVGILVDMILVFLANY